MGRALVIGLLLAAMASAGGAGAGGDPPSAEYRSDRFGWALSCPPGVGVRPYFGGQSADLLELATQSVIATLEVWPGDLCPRERSGTTAEAIGVERAESVTQADGDDGSSACGAPITLRRFVSRTGVALYELTLACTRDHRVGRRMVRSREGRKGPTFFADVSQPWRRRVLTVDPVGVDPRFADGRHPANADAVRRILMTLSTFAVPDPHVVCIEDLRNGSAVMRPAD